MKAMTMAGAGAGADEGGTLRLEDVAKQFRHWRESRVRGERIPAALWGEAVQMCQEHAPQRVAGVLRVALAGLMRHLELAGDSAAQRPGFDTEFVEVIIPTALPEPAASRLELAPTPEPPTGAATPTPAPECVLELENVHGAKMRVQLHGRGLANLGSLLRSFWGAT